MDPQQPTEIQSPSQPQMPAPKKSGALKWILIIVAIVVTLGVIGLVLFGIVGKKYLDSVEKTETTSSATNSVVTTSQSYQSLITKELCGKLVSQSEIENFTDNTYDEFISDRLIIAYDYDTPNEVFCDILAIYDGNPNKAYDPYHDEMPTDFRQASIEVFFCREDDVTVCHKSALNRVSLFDSERFKDYDSRAIFERITVDMGGDYNVIHSEKDIANRYDLQINDRVYIQIVWDSKGDVRTDHNAFIAFAHKIRDRLPAEYR